LIHQHLHQKIFQLPQKQSPETIIYGCYQKKQDQIFYSLRHKNPLSAAKPLTTASFNVTSGVSFICAVVFHQLVRWEKGKYNKKGDFFYKAVELKYFICEIGFYTMFSSLKYQVIQLIYSSLQQFKNQFLLNYKQEQQIL
jgi:hypothetical protein